MNESTVRALADMAALPLAPDREAIVLAILGSWVQAANELSRKMSAAQYSTLPPATGFRHPPRS